MSRASRRMWAVGSGMVVASVGFLLTRSATVASATVETSTAFLLGDLPFLVVGLALSVFGVGIAVSEWGRDHGPTVARWCLVGTATTGLAVTVSLFGAGIPMMLAEGATRGLALDLVLTGAIGGTITGVQASRRRESARVLKERNNRLVLLNRILRHEVLNGLNIVRGYASLLGSDQTRNRDGRRDSMESSPADGTSQPARSSSADGPEDHDQADPAKADGGEASATPNAAQAIERSAGRINDAVDELARLSRPGGTDTVELSPVLESCVGDARERYPHAEIELHDDTDGPAVIAAERVDHVFEHLLANAVEHNGAEAPTVEITVGCDWDTVSVTVADDGPGLPDRQRRILLDGTLPEYDDPGSGFGLTIVRLLATESNADVAVQTGAGGEATDGGTAITLTFRRHRAPDGIAAGSLDTGVPAGTIGVGALAATLAGIAMGIPLSTLQGSIPVIGVLYGSPSPVVGWTVHLFHSLVFGVGFVALLSGSRLSRFRSRPLPTAGIGIAYGIGVWIVAAGFVMPLWLRALGVEMTLPVPNLTAAGLFGHVIWGATFGGALAALRR